MRLAVIGAGPAGFYATDKLLAAGFEVDLLDALPTPFGLVRSGVAPDHPKIKAVTRVYEKTGGANPGFRFFGGVVLGETCLAQRDARALPRGRLRNRHAGRQPARHPRRGPAGLPRRPREFVAWYNGHPELVDQEFDLTAQHAVVIGNGNVAIDVARMLVLDPGELAPTDTADHAIDALAEAQGQEVVLLGRRGPAQAAFTNPELRELGELEGATSSSTPPSSRASRSPTTSSRPPAATWRSCAGYAQRPPGQRHRLELRFLRSPVEILGDGRRRAGDGHPRRAQPDRRAAAPWRPGRRR